jgi:H+/Cl- antiporter ClcA
VAFAWSAAVLVVTYAPYAFHTGIPEIKAILNGYVLDAFLSPWTLLIKSLGLALSVASGLSLGKEVYIHTGYVTICNNEPTGTISSHCVLYCKFTVAIVS